MAGELLDINETLWRLSSAEKQIERLVDRKAEAKDVIELVDAVRRLADNKAEARELTALAEDVKALRRAMWGVAGSVLSGAVLFALTVVVTIGPST